MRQKVLEHGPAALADYELLEMLLFNVIPRRDTKPLAKSLISHFGSLLSLCRAEIDELEQCKLGLKTISMLQFIGLSAVSLARTDGQNHFCFSDWERLMAYADRYRKEGTVSGVRVLYLNNRNELLLDHFLTDEQDIVSFHRQIAELALDVNATSVILIYIAPQRPATVIAQQVLGLKHAIHSLAIDVHDALLVGRDWKMTLYQEGLLSEHD